MKGRFTYYLLLLFLSSCFEPFEESVFEDSEPLVVIEANIFSEDPPYEVKVSRSVIPGEEVNETYINNAIIQLNDNLGNQIYFQPLGDGEYYLSEIKGQPEVIYYLDVFIDNEVYTANETMPKLPAIDSINYSFRENYVDGDGYYITLFMQKRKDTISYYKVDLQLGDSLFQDYSDLLIFDDSYTLQTFDIILPYAFKPEDSVTVDLLGISKNMYDYYYGISRQTTNLFSNIQPPMLNPNTNFTNGSLGYFQAASVVKLHQVIEAEK